ncbi:sensor histidine kinase [Pseudoalteromonas ulvae]|uniref:histidine kinase n=1 Tax=Pseudoalteromonas ulvae TaxID=107327 RepID=A0A2C9ZZM9_PSEDV|nr:HAMP domain-containing sensor histidine kinase [Pseudoalteromonas ulvae]OUL56216.1 hypothetical protein B1199_19080 [Pseudoalteromonas ulvae]
MQQTHRVMFTLTLVSTQIFTLSLTTLFLLNFSPLFLVSFGLVLAYVLCFFSFKAYQFWSQPWQDLIAFSQTKLEGEKNITLKFKDINSSAQQLALAITELSESQTHTQRHAHIIWYDIFEHWQEPIAVFQQQQLMFANHAFKRHFPHTALIGDTLKKLGFNEQQGQLSHSAFSQKWHSSSVAFKQNHTAWWFYSASNIEHSLQQQHKQSQRDIVRIMSHEIRNSLTPIASLSDTLLTNGPFNPEQVSKVLERIKQRSESLLSFIAAYANLSTLPPAQQRWTNIAQLCHEQATTLGMSLQFQGEQHAALDPMLFEQLLLNIFKNSQQAHPSTQLKAHCYHDNHVQVLVIKDTGPGFANLDNALNPLFTTKAEGQGLGLSLCQDIIQLHGGDIHLSNDDIGAVVTLSWPL